MAFLQCANYGWCVWRIAERNCDVAQPAFVADAADRRAFGAAQEFLFAPGEQLDKRGAVESVADMKSGSALLRANLFQGQTSWQSSQP